MPYPGILVSILFSICRELENYAKTMSRARQLSLVVLGDDIDSSAFTVKHNVTIDQREQRIVFALADAFARMPLVTDLASKDVTGDNALATEFFDSTTLGVRIATVAAGTLSLLMGH